MSGLLMGAVHGLKLPRSQRDVLIAMADHADDFGGQVFPSVSHIAWKTDYDRRTVQRAKRDLESLGVLVEVAPASRHRPVEYRIDLSKAPKKPLYRRPPAESRGDILSPLPNLGATFDESRGDIAVPPEPSLEPPSSSSDEEEEMCLVPSTVEEVFEYWRTQTGRNGKTKLTPERRRAVRDRLKQHYTVDDIKQAIDGCAASEWHVENRHTDLELICRKGKNVERFQMMATSPSKQDRNAKRQAERMSALRELRGEAPDG